MSKKKPARKTRAKEPKPHPAAIRMRKLRESKHLTQADFAAMLHARGASCSQVMVCQIETGHRPKPNIDVAFRIEQITKELGQRIAAKEWAE